MADKLNSWDRYTARAQEAIQLALREALSLGHNYVGTEHLLLGLVRQADTIPAQVLNAEETRNKVIALLSKPPKVTRLDLLEARLDLLEARIDVTAE